MKQVELKIIPELDEKKEQLDFIYGITQGEFMIGGSMSLKMFGIIDREIGDLDISIQSSAIYNQILFIINTLPEFEADWNKYPTDNHIIFKYKGSSICIFLDEGIGTDGYILCQLACGLCKIQIPSIVVDKKKRILKDYETLKAGDLSIHHLESMIKHKRDIELYNVSTIPLRLPWSTTTKEGVFSISLSPRGFLKVSLNGQEAELSTDCGSEFIDLLVNAF